MSADDLPPPAYEETEWPISKAEQARYLRRFRQLRKDAQGNVPGAYAKDCLNESGLSRETLGTLWDLADLDKDGALSPLEFCVIQDIIAKMPNTKRLPAGYHAYVREGGHTGVVSGGSGAAGVPVARPAGPYTAQRGRGGPLGAGVPVARRAGPAVIAGSSYTDDGTYDDADDVDGVAKSGSGTVSASAVAARPVGGGAEVGPNDIDWEYTDPWIALAFLLHLLVVAVMLGAQAKRSPLFGSEDDDAGDDDSTAMPKPVVRFLLTGVGAIGFASVCAAIAWMMLAYRHTERVIKGSAVVLLCLLFAFGVMAMAVGAYMLGVFAWLLCAILAVFFYVFRAHIPFAVTMLRTVLRLVDQYRLMVALAVASVVMLISYIVFCAVTYTAVRYSFAQLVFLIFSYYWVLQVLKNVVHCTVVNVYSAWYYADDPDVYRPEAVSLGLRRAMSFSFGSICLGSLIVATWQTVRVLVRMAMDSCNDFARQCVDCVMGILESWLRYFTKYSLVQVATHNKTYCRSARDTYEMIRTSAAGDAIINDNFIGSVLLVGALAGAMSAFVVSAIAGALLIGDYDRAWWFEIAFILALVAFAVMITVLEVVESGVAAIFLNFARHPEVLRASQPQLEHALRERLVYGHTGGAQGDGSARSGASTE